MSIYKSFGTDKNAEISGVWYVADTLEDGKEVRFKLARKGRMNKAFVKSLDKRVEPYRRAMELNKLSTEKNNELGIEVFCESILMAWENVIGREGKPLEFNFENAVQLMKDLPDLYDILNAKAMSADTFKDESLKAVVKN